MLPSYIRFGSGSLNVYKKNPYNAYIEETASKGKNIPCIFLSHRSVDKDACRKIAQYLENIGVYYYLDEEDIELQNADRAEQHQKVTECIQKGIEKSTHMMCILSKTSLESVWIPFEIGYAYSILQVMKNNNLSILTLEDLSESTLPAYLEIATPIKGEKSFINYIEALTKKTKYSPSMMMALHYCDSLQRPQAAAKKRSTLKGILNQHK